MPVILAPGLFCSYPTSNPEWTILAPWFPPLSPTQEWATTHMDPLVLLLRPTSPSPYLRLLPSSCMHHSWKCQMAVHTSFARLDVVTVCMHAMTKEFLHGEERRPCKEGKARTRAHSCQHTSLDVQMGCQLWCSKVLKLTCTDRAGSLLTYILVCKRKNVFS